MEFWSEIPPPNVSLAIIAQAHGATFEKPSEAAAADQESELGQLLAAIPQRPNPR